MRLPLLIFLLAGLPAAAAPVTVRTLAFDLPQPVVSFELVAAAGRGDDGVPPLQVEVRRNRFGDPVALAPGDYAARSDAFRAKVSFRLPATKNGRFLLLVLPQPGGGCHIMPIADEAGRIGPGDRFLLNVTASEIAIRLGSRKSRLKPGQSVVLRPPRPLPADRRIEVEMLRLTGTEWRPFNSTYWPLDPRARSFVLVYPDPASGAPRVRNLAEVP